MRMCFMRPDDRTLVMHMIDAAEDIGRFTHGSNAADLENDRILLFALVRALEVLGEAANGVTSETRALAPEIPWNLVVATRNRLIHGYFDVDPEIVWQTATVEVPKLLPGLRKLLEELS